ncbi:hypothetical protein KPL71_001439 [Citrus sinensis]|uniref:Uncharacterized protein n=1 Tax=Citrus sinensis TaxID=2711 RepID=A0ACB8NXT7_CITSI|nr:hypothetical protein KPL71_001439 [Citrus sinensis]
MDINLGLFSERLRRVPAGEEFTVPDAAKQPIQNLYTETEIIASWLRDCGYNTAWFMWQAIDTFAINITQQKSQSGCSEGICDALLGLQSKIIDIKQRMQQVQHIHSGIIDGLKSIEAKAGNFPASSSFKDRDTVGLDNRMEELLDLLIEGPPQLSVVAVLDSIGLDKTAFAAEAYSSNYVKHYFDCHAWVEESLLYDADQILYDIIKFVMPSRRLSEIMKESSEMKKIILHEYVMTKRYLIVLDNVWRISLWIAEGFIPDNNEAITEKYLEQLINGAFVDAGKRSDISRINTSSIPGSCSPALLTVAFKGEFIISPIMDQESIIPSLKSLPSSFLSSLLNLYTLEMPFSYIDHTADEFWKMSKLRLSCLESLKLANESKMPRRSNTILAEYQFPPSLTHLSFSNIELIDDPMPALEKLPVLQVLKLKYLGRKLACSSDGFPKLKVLHLKSMLWLEEWTMGIKAMPKLECVIINPCAHLKRIPEQLWCLKSLNKLELWWPEPKLRQQLWEFEDKEQYGIQLYPYGI